MALLLALLPPTLAWLAGSAWPPPRRIASPLWTAAAGALAAPAVLRWRGRPPAEQAVGWALGVVAWGGLLLRHDGAVFTAFSLLAASWCLAAAARQVGQGAAPARPAAPPLRPPSPPAEAPGADSADASEDRGPATVSIALRCPSCGGDVSVPAHHHMARCPYCASTHLVARRGGTLVAVVPDAVTGEAALRRAVASHYGHLRYLALYDRRVRPLVERHERSSGTDASAVVDLALPAAIDAAEAAVRAAADAHAAGVERGVVIRRWERFLSPYWHRMGTLYQAAFGRGPDGEKRMEVAITTLETSLPAASAPLPEMGRLSYLRALRPLAAAPEAALPALPPDRPAAAIEERMRQLSERRTGLALTPLARRATLVPEVEALVYRPWHRVEVEVDGTAAGFLVDGAAARVAGAPPPEVAPGPPPAAAPETLTLIASRCPECGGDLAFDPDAVAHLCRTCWRLVEVARGGLRALRYRSERVPPGAWALPFWRFPLRVRTAGGAVVTDLAHLADGIDGALDQIAGAPMGEQHYFVPAFRTRLGKSGVALLRRLWPLLHAGEHEATGERFLPSDPPPRVVDVTLPADEARVLAGIVLALAFTRRDLARASARAAREAFLDATVEGAPDLWFLAVPEALVEPYRRAFGRPLPGAVAALARRAVRGGP
jgi:DNA-directed RNA polymerase subunit RPC12/RpoP